MYIYNSRSFIILLYVLLIRLHHVHYALSRLLSYLLIKITLRWRIFGSLGISSVKTYVECFGEKTPRNTKLIISNTRKKSFYVRHLASFTAVDSVMKARSNIATNLAKKVAASVKCCQK